MRIGLIFILLIFTINISGQSIKIQTVIEHALCDSFWKSHKMDLYLVADTSDDFFEYNGAKPSCRDLIICNNNKELFKILRKKKEITVIQFFEIEIKDSSTKIYTFNICSLYLKYNRKKIKVYHFSNSFKVIFKKSVENRIWEISSD
jgi:hypothetical protein